MEYIFKYAWIFLVAGNLANAIYWKIKSKEFTSDQSEMKEGYARFIKAWIIYGNIPWAIIAIGNFIGITKSVFEYLNPSAGNPMVLIFHGTIILLMIMSVIWIYFRSGAEFLEKHPGLFVKKGFGGNGNLTAKEVKFGFPFVIVGGIIAMTMMWLGKVPLPPTY